MRIGELARRTGVSVRSLRYYEEQHLLPAVRSASGQRQYPESAVGRVELIQQLYAAGLSSKTILGIMPCMVTGEVTPLLLDRLTDERDRIDQQIAGLTSTRDRLDTIISASTDLMSRGERCTTHRLLPGEHLHDLCTPVEAAAK
ncbi:MerR family transcriptional regulator [Streptomyces youssoufiensis]